MYNDYDNASNNNGQRDLVLSNNEFCYVQSKSNGNIKVYTGPTVVTISAQETLVVFNSKTKRFEESREFHKAKQLFASAPEGWYLVLKNPTISGETPEEGKSMLSPELQIGHKINIPGPDSRALFPGQMVKIIRGHRLRSNQYLVARVYDAEAAKNGVKDATILDTEGNAVKSEDSDYFVGQLLIIKGTDVSFYIPPTGIEVIAIDAKRGEGSGNGSYVRDAVTLERLEYAILKDEDGEKRYVHGPAVVFPKPTETFVTHKVRSNDQNGERSKGDMSPIFRAMELSPISGIYVKVIADYTENGIEHKAGEELFITGKEQMIYYPRHEHTIIQYDGKYMHHAIAIPEGEGRYILDRINGTIKTVKGPTMYLPDPRKEVVVKRKLSPKECELMYPNNDEVYRHNLSLTEKSVEKLAKKGLTDVMAINCAYSTANQEDTLAIFEANAAISRGTSYTKPRTITLDTKFDGVVSIDVWTGYAINVVSKSGKREVVTGPVTRLLDYEETLEGMQLSTGKPKTTNNLISTAFLRIENNKVSDIIRAQTKDFVDVTLKLSYCVNFIDEYKDKWFSVENYVKYLTDRMRSLLKREIKKYAIEEFYTNSTDIIRKIVLKIEDKTEEKKDKAENSKNAKKANGRLFTENGMLVYDVEVLEIGVERNIANLLNAHNNDMIEKALELSKAEERYKLIAKIAETKQKELELQHENDMYELELKQEAQMTKFESEKLLEEKERAIKEARVKAEKDLQPILDEVEAAKLERAKKRDKVSIEHENDLAAVEASRQKAYAETVKEIMNSIGPDLVAALNARSNAEIMQTVADAVGPYAIANGESIADTTSKLLRGTTLEDVVKIKLDAIEKA